MVQAYQQFQYNFLNNPTRSRWLIKIIMTKDPSTVSAINYIQGNNQRRDYFEEASDFLLLMDPSGGTSERNQIFSSKKINRGN